MDLRLTFCVGLTVELYEVDVSPPSTLKHLHIIHNAAISHKLLLDLPVEDNMKDDLDAEQSKVETAA
jgi:hypothetical protein